MGLQSVRENCAINFVILLYLVTPTNYRCMEHVQSLRLQSRSCYANFLHPLSLLLYTGFDTFKLLSPFLLIFSHDGTLSNLYNWIFDLSFRGVFHWEFCKLVLGAMPKSVFCKGERSTFAIECFKPVVEMFHWWRSFPICIYHSIVAKDFCVILNSSEPC